LPSSKDFDESSPHLCKTLREFYFKLWLWVFSSASSSVTFFWVARQSTSKGFFCCFSVVLSVAILSKLENKKELIWGSPKVQLKDYSELKFLFWKHTILEVKWSNELKTVNENCSKDLWLYSRKSWFDRNRNS
jgi:hypothetical protein